MSLKTYPRRPPPFHGGKQAELEQGVSPRTARAFLEDGGVYSGRLRLRYVL
ncbi:hypothetical protein HMPREF1548_04787 [Clostridium sp. KLE 1755]|nr:hypothetical protein HMPREF1548_04787 [Clostridium sp. KLE 1755]